MDNTELSQYCYAMGYSDGEVYAFYDGYEKGRADAIEECIEILKDTSRRNCSYLLDEIVYRAVEQMENLKEQK